jgi:phage nucleotide-binding protein
VANRAKEIAKVQKRIIPVSEAEPHLKVLLYGRNGQGKTRIACTAPTPVLVLDINEKGTKSVRDYKGVDVLPVNAWEDVTYAYWMLRAGNHKYKSVVLDTMTALQSLCIRDVVIKEAEDRDPNRDPKTMSMREWGKMAEFLKPLILNFRNLDMNVVFTAQIRNGKDRNDEEAEDLWVPDMSPNPRSQLTAAVDIIGYVHQKEVRTVNKRTQKEVKSHEHRMLVGPHENYVTKDRTGQLGQIVRNPQLAEIAAMTTEDEE